VWGDRGVVESGSHGSVSSTMSRCSVRLQPLATPVAQWSEGGREGLRNRQMLVNGGLSPSRVVNGGGGS
jgi:hypothetical protein